MHKTIPQPREHGLFGPIGAIRRDFLGTMAQWHEQCGDMLRFRLAGRVFFLVSHPSLAEAVLVQQQDVFEKMYDPDRPQGLGLVLGNGLVTSRGELWRRQRQQIQPIFHRSPISHLAPVITAAAERMLKRWSKLPHGEPLDISTQMTALTLEIITQGMFGTSVEHEVPRLEPALATVLQFAQRNFLSPFRIPLRVPTRANRQFVAARALLRNTIGDLIEQRRLSQKRQDDFLDLLLHARDSHTDQPMSDQQIMDEALTIFSAGHETTATALSWAIYLISSHPEVHKKLFAELDAIGGVVPTVGDLPSLPFTFAIWQETLRLYPPAVVVIRVATRDTNVQGYDIPKGATIIVNIRNIHRHPQLWSRPSDFNPQRFLGSQSKLPRLAYMPFGAGPRVCVGSHLANLEGHLLLAQIFQRFLPQVVPGHPVEPALNVTLRPKYGLQMRLEPRTAGPHSIH